VEHHGRRIGAAPGPVVARDRPGVALLRLAAARVEYRHGGLVGEQARRGLQGLVQALHHRRDLAGCRASQSARTARLIPIPWRARICACRYSGK
jgi:hypothetical protein